VALFFTLSGFLLALPLWSHTPAHRISRTLRGFGRKRLARIVPAYYFCLTGLVLLQTLRGDSPGLRNVLLHYATLHNYSNGAFYAISAPFWTIAVQTQFYFVFAAVVWMLGQIGATSNRLLAVVIAGLCAMSYGVHLLIMTRGPGSDGDPGPVLTHSVLAHLPLFCLGVLAAGAFVSVGRQKSGLITRPGFWDVLFGVSTLTVVAILSTDFSTVCEVPFGRYHFPFVPALLALMITAAPLSGIVRSALQSWPLCMLGLISYGFYVYHFPCLLAVALMLDQIGISPNAHPFVFAGIGLAATLMVSAGSFIGIEKPLERWLRRPVDPVS